MGAEVWIDIKSVGHDPGVDTQHVLLILCKYILILFEKLDQPFAELGVEKRTNADDSIRLVVIQCHWYYLFHWTYPVFTFHWVKFFYVQGF